MSSIPTGVAVIGMDGRFPAAPSPDALWELLLAKRDGILRPSVDQLRSEGVDPEVIRDPAFVRAKGVLDAVDEFDASLFGYAAAEAELLDPQQRLFLELAFGALEDACTDPDRFEGAIGIFGGALLSSYLIRNLLGHTELTEPSRLPMLFQANQPDQLAARAAYKLNLSGPAITVQTACSTSLVAVHLAVQALLDHSCDMALAGGVAITVPRMDGYVYVDGGVMSPDGRCRPFDDAANGTVFSNGGGIVALRRLEDALVGGDRIRAVILATAVGNDGADRSGFTAPSPTGQANVIREAIALAGLRPRDLGYVETHGTGTALGDPIEFAGLCEAFSEETGHEPWCALGAMKGNVGHMDTASGIASFIKAVLAVERGLIPPNRHEGERNHRLPLEGSPFLFPERVRQWEASQPRYAGVSSFGIGGTNAHVILGQPPAGRRRSESSVEPPVDPQVALLPLSAATPRALEDRVRMLADHLERRQESPHILFQTAATLQLGRRQLSHRVCIGTRSAAEAVSALRALPAATDSGLAQTPQVMFLLPGQGTQFHAMGMTLYERYSAFRNALCECDTHVRRHLNMSLFDILRDHGSLSQTEYAQPAIFSVSWAMAQLWRSFGVVPDLLLGHSLGEVVAACLAGVWDLPHAIEIVVERGRLLTDAAGGAMLAVALSSHEARSAAGFHGLDLAAVNGPRASVLSGSAEAIEKAAQTLRKKHVGCVLLEGEYAFHSRMCERAAVAFSEFLARIPARRPAVPFISNVTGAVVADDEAMDPAYWAQQLRETVNFAAALETAREYAGRVVALETGPGETLSRLARRSLGPNMVVTAPLRAGSIACPEISAGEGWALGVTLDWRGVGSHHARVPLPAYPFDRHRYWRDPAPLRSAAVTTTDGISAAGALCGAVRWRRHQVSHGTSGQQKRRRTWLILDDHARSAQPLAEALSRRGDIVTSVLVGPSPRRVSRDLYEVNPSADGSFEQLFRLLRGLVRTPNAIVHAWGMSPEVGTDSGSMSILRLARALASEGVVHQVDGTVLTRRAYRVRAGDTVNPEAAMLGAAASATARDIPNLCWSHFDLDLGEPLLPVVDLLRRGPESPNESLAVRGDEQWAREIVWLPRHERVLRPRHLRARGVYAITGGLGGLGSAFAEFLARTCEARVAVLTRHPDSEAADTTRRAVEVAGGSFLALRADVTQPDEVKSAFAAVRERFGPMDGLIHAAGVPAGGSVEHRSDADLLAVHAPKVVGAKLLLAELADDEAPLVVMCSSVASLCPPFGQADYVSANSYLDALATTSSARTVMTVNWDAWAGVGMAASQNLPPALAKARDSLLADAITPGDGVEALARILDGDETHVVVARQNTEIRDGRIVLRPRDEALRATPNRSRPEIAVPFRAPETETERRVSLIFGEVLGASGIGVDDDFLELGGHSLLAAQLVARLRSSFGVDLATRTFFEGATPALVADAIESRLADELEGRDE